MDKHFENLDKKQTSLEHQDWTPQVVRKKNDNVDGGGSKKKVSQAQQRDNKLMKKVDDDDLKHDKITLELRVKIQQGRASQKWTQKDLANRCNLPVTVINEIESGKAIYNPQQINKIKRILKIK
uniref:HTH cro/C1-type domain-containing protein n=1 Tax=viral metagenome TaxID=1070528 RepID=A0A6C0CEQ4_9ZZZZ|tara:strand:- start:728 stop:1099 length:372 start_codon:yes stop_codon:yes gene_type:complete